jgi:hypothetical protein
VLAKDTLEGQVNFGVEVAAGHGVWARVEGWGGYGVIILWPIPDLRLAAAPHKPVAAITCLLPFPEKRFAVHHGLIRVCVAFVGHVGAVVGHADKQAGGLTLVFAHESSVGFWVVHGCAFKSLLRAFFTHSSSCLANWAIGQIISTR